MRPMMIGVCLGLLCTTMHADAGPRPVLVGGSYWIDGNSPDGTFAYLWDTPFPSSEPAVVKGTLLRGTPVLVSIVDDGGWCYVSGVGFPAVGDRQMLSGWLDCGRLTATRPIPAPLSAAPADPSAARAAA